MDKKLKAEWVKALMSGKYEQGEGSLYRNGKYCCLGVLCKEMGATNATLKDWGTTNDIYKYYVAGSLEIENSLAYLNDSCIPFPVIAGFIQENL